MEKVLKALRNRPFMRNYSGPTELAPMVPYPDFGIGDSCFVETKLVWSSMCATMKLRCSLLYRLFNVWEFVSPYLIHQRAYSDDNLFSYILILVHNRCVCCTARWHPNNNARSSDARFRDNGRSFSPRTSVWTSSSTCFASSDIILPYVLVCESIFY